MKILFIFLFLTNFTVLLECNDKPLNILFFHSYQQSLPWTKQMIEGIEDFIKEDNNKIELFVESIDYVRLKNKLNPEFWKEYLKNKYKNIKFDGIIIDTLFAAKVFDTFSEDLYPNIPKIYSTDYPIKSAENIIIYNQNRLQQVENTIKLVKKQNPNVKNFYVIKTNSPGESLEQILLNELKNEKLTIIKDFTIDELKMKLSNLPPNSVVFCLLNFYDKSGKRFVPKEFLEKIAKNSSTPIYSFWGTFIGTGIVGGYMIDGKTLSKNIMKNLTYYLKNGTFLNNSYIYSLFLDYQVLEKFNIDINNYPSDTKIINKPIPIWKSYPQETFFGVSVIVLLTLLLILFQIIKIKDNKIRKIEQNMIIHSRQAATGEIISIIAHQWKQPLNNISIIIQTLVLKYLNNKLDNILINKFKNESLKQINFMSTTINEFCDFYKPDKEKSKFDIKNELFKTVELIKENYAKMGIEIDIQNIDNFVINGFPNELAQCFLIILQNAKDILLKNNKKNKLIKIYSHINAKNYILCFENNGDKISENILNKVFEPYFSTKKSTGIGLYIAKMIIKKYKNSSITALNTDFGVKFEIKFYL